MSDVAEENDPSITRRKFLKGALLAGGVAALGGATQAQQRSDVQFLTTRLALPKWTAPPMTVGFLADLHVNGPSKVERALRAVDWVMRQNPRVIVFGGDMFTYPEKDVIDSSLKALEPLQHYQGPVLGIAGNHDAHANDERTLRPVFQELGIRLLWNESAVVGDAVFYGISSVLKTDPIYTLDSEEPVQNLVTLLHEPDYVGRTDARSAVVLAGHTHGGQVCLPFGVPINRPKGGEHYTAGFYPSAPRPLFVTRGVGTTSLDIRTFCPPEACMLTLASYEG